MCMRWTRGGLGDAVDCTQLCDLGHWYIGGYLVGALIGMGVFLASFTILAPFLLRSGKLCFGTEKARTWHETVKLR